MPLLERVFRSSTLGLLLWIRRVQWYRHVEPLGKDLGLNSKSFFICVLYIVCTLYCILSAVQIFRSFIIILNILTNVTSGLVWRCRLLAWFYAEMELKIHATSLSLSFSSSRQFVVCSQLRTWHCLSFARFDGNWCCNFFRSDGPSASCCTTGHGARWVSDGKFVHNACTQLRPSVGGIEAK